MRHRQLLLRALFLVAIGAATCRPVLAEGRVEEPQNEVESWESTIGSRECQRLESRECEALTLLHYCKYEGSSPGNAAKCEGGKHAEAERLLNLSYRRLLLSLKKAAAEDQRLANTPKMLMEAQRAWIAFRVKECAFQSESMTGGTLQPAAEEDCLRREALKRVEALKQVATIYGAHE